VEHLQRQAAPCPAPAAESISCCLADEWTLAEPQKISAAEPPAPKAEASAADFCCIAAEWRMQ
jgi:hypothetical protein